jgi:molecular chaperone GrpE (heat shock protein)
LKIIWGVGETIRQRQNMAAKPKKKSKGLHGIRDMALLLNMANEHLCEEVYLQKAGLAVDNHLEELKSDISFLKKKFPGQFVKEVNTDQVIDNFQGIIQQLQEPDKETLKKCSTGALGLELENVVNVMEHTLGTIKSQVEGELGTYTKADESVLTLMGWIKSISRQIFTLSALTVRITSVAAAILLVVFVALFLTMDSQTDLLDKISQYQTHIQGQLAIISSTDAEKERINRELNLIGENEASRQEKTRVLDLTLEIHEINEKALSAQAEIDAYKRRIDEIEKKIDEMNKKHFIARLLRF